MRLHIDTPPSWFVHVSKTGGISLGSVVESAYRVRDRVRLNPPYLAKLTIPDLGRFHCYHDFHLGRSMLELVGRRDLVVFTMLRDPVERTVSQIRYLQRMVAEIPHTFTREFIDDVKPLLQADLTRPLDLRALKIACESQISILGVLRDYRPLFAGSPDVKSGRSVIRPYPFLLLSEDESAPESLARATAWLTEMDVVCIHEHYEESVQMVCTRLGIASPPALPRTNRNPERVDMSARYRSQLPSIVLEQIEEFTQRDRELYAFACDQFHTQRARQHVRPVRHYSIGPRARVVKRAVIDTVRRMAPADTDRSHRSVSARTYQLKDAHSKAIDCLVSIIIPTKNAADLLRTTVAGVLHHTDFPNLEVIIVDNGSDEPEALRLLDELRRSPNVSTRSHPGAFNFSTMCNIGARASSGTVLCFLNNDVRITQPGWLRELTGLALQSDVGAAGPLLFYPDGRVQHMGIDVGDGQPRLIGDGMPAETLRKSHALRERREVDALTGACLVMARTRFDEINGFDERLAVAYNDVDLCLRLRSSGLRAIWTPFAELVHEMSASRGSTRTDADRARFAREWDHLRTKWGNSLSSDKHRENH